MPPAVSSSNSSSSLDLGLRLGIHLLEDLFGGLLFQFGERCRRLRPGAISSTMSAAFSGSSDSRMLACILGSRFPKARRRPLRCRWFRRWPRVRPGPVPRRCRPGRPDASPPASGRRCSAAGGAADRAPPRCRTPSGWNWAGWAAAAGGSSAGGITPCSRRRKMLRMPMSTSSTMSMSRPPSLLDLHGDVGDAHHFAAGDIDDLLVQQVARDAQHVLVVVVRGRAARR